MESIKGFRGGVPGRGAGLIALVTAAFAGAVVLAAWAFGPPVAGPVAARAPSADAAALTRASGSGISDAAAPAAGVLGLRPADAAALAAGSPGLTDAAALAAATRFQVADAAALAGPTGPGFANATEIAGATNSAFSGAAGSAGLARTASVLADRDRIRAWSPGAASSWAAVRELPDPIVPPSPGFGWGLPAVADAWAVPQPRLSWPLSPDPVVAKYFDAPETPYGPGHRGVDLAAVPGQDVLAADAGVVVFAGLVAGRPVISVDHDGGLRTTYEPVAPKVAAGEQVFRGQVLGTVLAGHPGCAVAACLHWGCAGVRSTSIRCP